MQEHCQQALRKRLKQITKLIIVLVIISIYIKLKGYTIKITENVKSFPAALFHNSFTTQLQFSSYNF